MKDPHDKATRDLIDKPRRGRPVTGKAKSQAQIQREYRQRKKLKKQAQGDPISAQPDRLLLVWAGLLELGYRLTGDDQKRAHDLAELIAPPDHPPH